MKSVWLQRDSFRLHAEKLEVTVKEMDKDYTELKKKLMGQQVKMAVLL